MLVSCVVQGRITDHRIGLTLHGMEAMLDGTLLPDFLQVCMHACPRALPQAIVCLQVCAGSIYGPNGPCNNIHPI